MSDIKQKFDEASYTADRFFDKARVIPVNSAVFLCELAIAEERKKFLSTLDDDSCECDNCNRTRKYFQNPKKELLRNKNKCEAEVKKAIAEDRKRIVEMIEKFLLQKHIHFDKQDSKMNFDFKHERPYVDSLELEEFIKQITNTNK